MDRVIALIMLKPAILPPGEGAPVPIEEETDRAPEAVWVGMKKILYLASIKVRIPDRPSLRTNGAISLLLLHAFRAWTGPTLPFTFYFSPVIFGGVK